MSDLSASVSLFALVAQLNSSVAYASAIMIALPAMFAAMSLAYLGSRFLDCAARQPEAESKLFSRLLVIAGVVDAAVILSIVFGYMMFSSNPLSAVLVKAIV